MLLGQVQAEPGSYGGWSKEAVHVSAPERQGRAGPFPLQRTWSPQANRERGDLGLQQGASLSSSVKTSRIFLMALQSLAEFW